MEIAQKEGSPSVSLLSERRVEEGEVKMESKTKDQFE